MKHNNSPKKNPREKSKTRAWEKERRDRLSECFDKLREALPNYDASKKLSKGDILIVATSTIKDLDEKIKNLLASPENEKNEEQKLKVSSDIIKKLEDRVKKLLVRNEELVNLLKNAGIRVPSAFGPVKKFSRTYKNSNKITHDQANILQKELEKENQIKPPKPPKPKKTKRNTELKYKRASTKSKNNRSLKKQLTNFVSSSNCLFIVSQPRILNNSCYIFSRSPRKISQTVIANSLLLKTPIVSSNIKPSILSTNPPLSDLGPGTWVFANGTVMPVVPTPPPLPVLSTIFTNPVQTKLPTFIVVSCNTTTISTNKISASTGTKSTVNSSVSNLDSFLAISKPSLKDPASGVITRPLLKPKTCITRTTQINKVPIPALSSKYNNHSCLESLKTQSDDKKTNCRGLKNEIKTPSEKNLNNKSGKRKVQENAQQEPKKHKIDLEESKKNLENSAQTTHTTLEEQSSSLIEITASCTESEKFVSRIIEKKQECPKADLEPDENIKISVFDFEKQTPTTVDELCKNSTINVTKPLEIQNINCNKGSHINHAFDITPSEDNTKKISTPNEIGCHSIKKTSSVVDTEKSNGNGNVIEKNIQTKMCDPAKTGCEPLISVELASTINSSVTTDCNKQVLKTFEMNMSQSESLTKNSNTNDLKALELNLPQSELSNDIFASFQVPSGCQNPGSTSPTAAFLLAFPLVSSGAKVTEVMGDETSESHAGTPNLLQIGTMEISKPTQSYSDSLTPNILNFENFSFFSAKDNCGGFYNNCSLVSTACQTSTTMSVTNSSKASSSLIKSTPVPPQSVADHGKQNINSKLNTNDDLTFLSRNKIECNNIKVLNQRNYKTDMAEKVSTNNKSGNVNALPEPLRSSKDLEVQSYISPSCNFNKGNELGNITTNILDMNPNSFSSKIVSNDNYTNKVKSNMSGQASMTKSSDICTNYPNYRDCTPFITNSVVSNKTYNSVYTSAANNDYFYNSSGSAGDNRHFNSSNFNNYSDYRKPENYNTYNESSQVYNKDKFNQNVQLKMKPSSSQNKPINWMTSPSTTVSYKPEYFLPSFSKEHHFTPNLSTNTTFTLPSNTYFNTSSVYNPNDNLNSTSDIRKTADLSLPTYNSYQRTESEENQFSWSPNKMPQFLDQAHSHTFVSSTLPTLVGDLALNNTPILEQKNTKDKNRVNQRKVGNCESGQTNFLSVSQLVEHNQEQAPAKVISRRSSGNRSKTNTPKSKRVVNRSDTSKDIPNYQKNDKINQQKHYDISVASNLFGETKQQPRSNKNVSSSYSAEALIGNQMSTDSSAKRNIGNHSKSIVTNFLSENIVSCFPAVDVSQDNGYIQTNQSFQANSFPQNFTTTFQNNTYNPNNFIPSACTLTSTYIPNNNFMPSSNNQDFLGENPNMFQNNNVQTKDKNNYMKTYYRQTDKNEKNQAYNCKKAKKRSINESTLPSFDIPFLSMPGAINSPILPDDFHTTYLPPTTLYSCKNPLYSKPNSEITPNTLIPSLPAISGSKSGIQHSDMSPSVNSVGTSLTNFNLSTIFPEINKGPVQENFSDTRSRDYHPVSKSFAMSSSLQVPFNSKSSIPFGTFGT